MKEEPAKVIARIVAMEQAKGEKLDGRFTDLTSYGCENCGAYIPWNGETFMSLVCVRCYFLAPWKEGDKMIEEGMRVRLTRDVDRFPDFLAKAGTEGKVIRVSFVGGQEVRVKMDEPIPGAEEWDNCILWNDEQVRNVTADLEVIG